MITKEADTEGDPLMVGPAWGKRRSFMNIENSFFELK